MTGLEIRQPRHQPLLHERRQGRHRDLAFAAIAARGVDRLLELAQASLDARQQPLALGCELEVTTPAAQQRQLQVILERLQLHADRARRDTERVGCAADAHVLGHRGEYAQAADGRATERRGVGLRSTPGPRFFDRFLQAGTV